MKVFAILFLLASLAFAAPFEYVAVFETMTEADNTLTEAEQRYLTNELRKQAVSVLPTQNYSVLTRDNILSLLPPDKSMAECLEGQCLIEIGRNVGAEYAVQGTVSKFGSKLTLTVEAYETKGGTLLGSFTAESLVADGLLESIRSQAPDLFRKIISRSTERNAPPPPTSAAVLDLQPIAPVAPPPPIPTNIPSEPFQMPGWVAWSLDALGALALGAGFYLDYRASQDLQTYNNMPRDPRNSRDPFDAQWNKVEESKKWRNYSYGAGAILLAGGLTFHIVF